MPPEDRGAVERASGGAPDGPDAGAGHPDAPAPGSTRPGTADPAGAAFSGIAPVLVLRHAAKSFGAVQALLDGSIELYPGEAHALVGENGAGKSTLVKILAGVHQPDSGELTLGGEPVSFSSPSASRAAGVSIIY